MKNFDLEPGQWRNEDGRQPILGSNGKAFLKSLALYAPLGLVAHAIATYIVTGETSRLMKWLLE